MAINPLELKPSGAVPTEERRRSPPANKAGRSFADVLTSSLDAKTETSTTTTNKATAAAELFRLEMMKAALSLDAPLSDPSFRSSQEAIIALITRLANSEDKHIPAPLVQQPIVAPPPLQAAPEIEDTISEPETALLQEMLSTRQAPPEKANAIPFALSLDTIISKAALRYGVDKHLIKAIIKTESNFNPHALSHAGAQGLMQLMPATARTLGVNNAYDPEQNVMAGTRFLKGLLERYGGNLDKALAAYNWGPGNLDRNQRLPEETRQYLARVKKHYKEFVA